MLKLNEAGNQRRMKTVFADSGKTQRGQYGKEHASEEAFPSLVRRNSGIHPMTSKEHADKVSSDIASPSSDNHKDEKKTGIQRLIKIEVFVIFKEIMIDCNRTVVPGRN